MSANINLRVTDDLIMEHLKQEAKANHISVNTLILQLLRRGLGLVHERHKPIYHELDKYAGTWDKKEADKFLNSLSDFEKIDEALWS
ncbi:MAG: hypothetical protein V3V61_06840 [Gammaproteobacteria bacterium]